MSETNGACTYPCVIEAEAVVGQQEVELLMNLGAVVVDFAHQVGPLAVEVVVEESVHLLLADLVQPLLGQLIDFARLLALLGHIRHDHLLGRQGRHSGRHRIYSRQLVVTVSFQLVWPTKQIIILFYYYSILRFIIISKTIISDGFLG